MKKIIIVSIILFSFITAGPVFAVSLGKTVNSGLNFGTVVGWGTQDVKTVIMLVINVIMGFLGIIAVIGVVYGGVKMMIAGGNEDQAGQGKKAIAAGIIGLAVVVAAWAIAAFVVQNLVRVT